MKKIGILGSGVVAKVLAKGFLQYGHEVIIGTRDPSKLEFWRESEPHIKSVISRLLPITLWHL
ncbi:MAG: hypothetical protein E4H10_10520 [Bacteroidia bacterium]|nr:MAG: hypothetical protein E4H10_10520 [Bacteroidia bacterium]